MYCGSLHTRGFLIVAGSLSLSGFLPFDGSSNLVIDPKFAFGIFIRNRQSL